MPIISSIVFHMHATITQMEKKQNAKKNGRFFDQRTIRARLSSEQHKQLQSHDRQLSLREISTLRVSSSNNNRLKFLIRSFIDSFKII